jgi:membrane fusion protein, heavy metal efflux system
MSDSVAARSARPPRIVWVAGIAAIIVAAVTALALSARNNERPAAAATHPGARDLTTVTLDSEQQAAVTVGTAAMGDLPVRAAAPGRVEFNENRVTPLFTQFSGRVVRLDVEVGAVVKDGQAIGLLDSPDVVGIQAEYQEDLAAVRAARTSHDQAERTRDRAARLADVEAIPLRELQEAQASERRAAEDLLQAETRLAAARGRLQTAGFTDDEIERLTTGGAAAITRLVPLKAPVAGTVVERHVGLGQIVQTGGDALLKIADLSTVWITADVYEDQLAAIHPGAEIMIQTPAYPNETFTGRVDRIAATLDSEKRTVAVRCVLPNRDGRLKPGMFSTVALQSGTIRRALLVPASAIVTSANRRSVFVEQAPLRYQQRDVEIGDEIASWVVVTSGLRPGERIVTQGGVLLSRQLAEAASR